MGTNIKNMFLAAMLRNMLFLSIIARNTSFFNDKFGKSFKLYLGQEAACNFINSMLEKSKHCSNKKKKNQKRNHCVNKNVNRCKTVKAEIT